MQPNVFLDNPQSAKRQKRIVELEQYFTCDSLVKRCIAALTQHFHLANFDFIIEPSAGDGAFLKHLPVDNCVGIDIEPRHPSVQEADFLTWRPEPTKTNGRILTIGNPPFGQRGVLAMHFLQRACLFSDVIAFILPRSFKKHTFQNRIDRRYHCLEQFDCDDFRRPDGTKTHVKCVFQIWEKRNEDRLSIQLDSEHPDFSMKHCHLSRVTPEAYADICREYEFAIAQVGGNFIPREPASLQAGSYWFIKPNCSIVRSVFSRLDFSFLENTNATFTSLSKKDIILAYKHALEGSNR
jgi:hypothetical protein